MRKSASPFVVLILVVLAGLTPRLTSAQEAAPMTAQRSWEVQATLAGIEADKADFVHKLFMNWTPYVDTNVYDLWGELQSVAMKAPAWQLYGASLVGDFETMVRVIRGEEGAGRYINALAEAEPKAVHDPLFREIDPNAFPTGTTDNLVYVPIAPCRVVDTRGVGARTGVIPANGTRSFDLEAQGLSSGQGGDAACAGLPSFSHYGWAVNITVTGYSGVGFLKAWGFSAAETSASVINFSTTIAPAVANGLILTGCYACVDDITIRASSATHVIIDVMGYFQSAATTGASTTRVAGTGVSVSGGSRNFVSGGACPGGTQLVGGELDWLSGGDVLVGEMARSSSTTMRFWVVNMDAGANTAQAYSVCQDTPIKAVP